MRLGLHAFGVVSGLLAGALLLGCGSSPPPTSSPSPDTQLGPMPGVPWFEDATTAANVAFTHFDGATAMHYLPEVMGSGVGWIDYDNDGWPDLFCVQGGPLRPHTHPGPLPTHKLYRNNRDGTFTEVTEQVGLNKNGYGMGVAVGDYDNDGFDDLFVTYLDRIALFKNVLDPAAPGRRRFEDVTVAARLANPHWATSCGWGDIDGDGRLDLYVCNYVQIDLDHYRTCVNTDRNQVYVCPPTVFPSESHKLFRNNGDGTFTDITVSSGIAAVPTGAGLGVLLLDLDDDGKIDIYVANDMGPAHLLQNQGGGKFIDRGLLSGASLTVGGRFMAGMGIAAGDIDGSGRPSLFVTNYQNEPTAVFRNQGKMTFMDWNHQSGVGPVTRRSLGFGIVLFDADLDGNLDLAQTNGHVVRNSQVLLNAPFEQEGLLMVGDGKGRFREVSEKAGGYFREKHVGRGLAVSDYNNDGLPDLAFSHNAGPLKLLRNATQTNNRWLRLELIGNGKTSNRNAIGARVEIETGGRKLVRFIHGGGSYLSASDRRLLVGLGTATKADRVLVVWPDGSREAFRDLAANRGWRLTQGKSAEAVPAN